MNILYVALKHVIWGFWICNYFREIFKFRDFMNTSRNFEKFVLLVFSRKILYWRNLQITCFKMIYNMFIFLKLEIFSDTHSGAIGESFRENLFIKSRNQNISEKFKGSRNLQTIPFKIMYNMSVLRHRFSNDRGTPWTTFLSYSVKVCIRNKWQDFWNRDNTHSIAIYWSYYMSWFWAVYELEGTLWYFWALSV